MNIIQIISAALTPVIAIAMVYIAYRQYSINSHKLKMELYEKRYKLFDDLKQYLLKISSAGPSISIEDRIEYTKGFGEFRFVFEQEIIDFLEEIEVNLKSMIALDSEIEQYGVGTNERNQLCEDWGKIQTWFTNEHRYLHLRFEKYLNLNSL